MPAAVEKRGDVVVIRLKGKLRMGESVDEFRLRWQEALSAGSRGLVVNLAGVPVLDSTGIGSLLRCQTAVAGEGGKLCLVGTNKVIRQALRVTRLDMHFEFHENEDSALASLAKSSDKP